jgi:hypothetical protein
MKTGLYGLEKCEGLAIELCQMLELDEVNSPLAGLALGKK